MWAFRITAPHSVFNFKRGRGAKFAQLILAGYSAVGCCVPGLGAYRVPGKISMQQHVSGLDDVLQLRLGDVGQRDRVVVAEIDHRVAVRVGGDQRLQFLRGLHIGEVIELEHILLRVEIDDGVGADAGREHEMIAVRAADRHRDGLRRTRRRILRVGDGDIVGLGQRLAGRQIHLIVSGHEVEIDRSLAVALGRLIEREAAVIIRAVRRGRGGERGRRIVVGEGEIAGDGVGGGGCRRRGQHGRLGGRSGRRIEDERAAAPVRGESQRSIEIVEANVRRIAAISNRE